MTGIYCIKNLITHKMYIGQSIDVNKRIKKHFQELRLIIHSNKELQFDYNKYGIESFIIGVIEYCNIIDLNDNELKYIQKYNCINDGYNKELPCFKQYIQTEINNIQVYHRNTYSKLATFETIDSLVFIMSIHPSKITPVLEYRSKSYNDYIFIAENDSIESYINKWIKIDEIKNNLYVNGKYINWKNNSLKAAEANRKPIFKLTLSDEFIEEYKCIKDACNNNTDYKYKGLYKAISGEKKSYRGFKWQYK